MEVLKSSFHILYRKEIISVEFSSHQKKKFCGSDRRIRFKRAFSERRNLQGSNGNRKVELSSWETQTFSKLKNFYYNFCFRLSFSFLSNFVPSLCSTFSTHLFYFPFYHQFYYLLLYILYLYYLLLLTIFLFSAFTTHYSAFFFPVFFF